jgi:guanylate cyclase
LFSSKRRGFLHYVKGVIHDIAKQLFDTEVEIELLDHETEDNMEHGQIMLLIIWYTVVDFSHHASTFQQSRIQQKCNQLLFIVFQK